MGVYGERNILRLYDRYGNLNPINGLFASSPYGSMIAERGC